MCIDAGASSAAAVRAAASLAGRLGAEWRAVHVETPAPAPDTFPERVTEYLRLAQQLGGDVVRLSGTDPVEEVVRYAKAHGARILVTGNSTRSRLRSFFAPSFPEEVLRFARGIDVYVISEQGTERRRRGTVGRHWDRAASGAAILAVAVATGLAAFLFDRSQLSEVVMVYLLAVVVVSLRFGFWPSIIAAGLSVLSFDLLFVPPYLHLGVEDSRYLVTFAVMFGVAFAMIGLTKRVRDQAIGARQRETRTARLYAMSSELASTLGIAQMLEVAVRHIHDAFQADVAVLLPNEAGELETAVDGRGTFVVEGTESRVAEWVWTQERSAGLGTEVFPGSEGEFLLLRGSRGKVGILGIRPSRDNASSDREERQLLNTFAAQLSSAVERGQLAEAGQRVRVEMETERLRSSLLSSVSHDLRTPLGVITGATSTLLQDDPRLLPNARRELLESAHEEANRLNRLVGNLLDMTRLASGPLHPKKEWHPLDEAVGVALNRLEPQLGGRDVRALLPSDLPPVPMDAVLVEQVLINLLDNAVKYTPSSSPIEISALWRGSTVEVAVRDRGPGVPVAERTRIFEKFHRLKPEASVGGAGLGLAICRGIVEAHGGRIWVDEREGGGAAFRFSLPLDEVQPLVPAPWLHAS
ncbi:MAG TPA: ATP-binding protein [Polyangiaceae bacterium]|nr:ATP-binding protein [Polyangiaceae bacterium]